MRDILEAMHDYPDEADDGGFIKETGMENRMRHGNI
jgi:hypothetical protein